jgi:hypothetical protein
MINSTGYKGFIHYNIVCYDTFLLYIILNFVFMLKWIFINLGSTISSNSALLMALPVQWQTVAGGGEGALENFGQCVFKVNFNTE